MCIRDRLTDVWAKGGEGGIDLAEKVIKEIDNNNEEFHYLYAVSYTHLLILIYK